jgi:PKD repeat protein
VWAGRNVTFTATAIDPGPDDLTFTWDWGDGSPANVSFYPSGGANPFTATDVQTHAYSMAGAYYLELTVSDDDGGEVEVVVLLVVP